MNTIDLRYSFPLKTPKSKRKILDNLLENQRELYNAALQEVKDAYLKQKKFISYYDQSKSLTEIRNEFQDIYDIPVHLQRGTLSRLHKSLKRFFKGIKKSEKVGFPRFKSKERFKTLEWKQYLGIKLEGNHLKSKAFGSLKINFTRPFPDNLIKINNISLTKKLDKWYVNFSIKIPKEKDKEIESIIGIDLGLEKLITLSEKGDYYENLRIKKKYEEELKEKQQLVSRAKKGSNNRLKKKKALNRVHNKINNIKSTYLHTISRELVNIYDLIAIENLNIKGMIEDNKYNLNESIYNISWATLINMLIYKAESAGKLVVKVNPKNTTKMCSRCGHIQKKSLSQRKHQCVNCGLILDRDHNAAINILNKAVVSLDTGLLDSYYGYNSLVYEY